jgi:hypothetical protein
MKKLCVGVLLALALLSAQAAFADPCGLCQAYYPCSWSCEHCVGIGGRPALWIDGNCTGEVVSGTCGDVGQCSGLQASIWSCEPAATPAPAPAPAAAASPAD